MRIKRVITLIIITVLVSVFTTASKEVPVYAATTSRDISNDKATIEMYNMIQKYASPKYYRSKKYKEYLEWAAGTGKLSGRKYEKLAKVARSVTRNCKNDTQRIECLAKYIANRTFYDYPYYYNETRNTYLTAYNVWRKKKTVCQGYANLFYALAHAIGIPAMIVWADSHCYSAAYNRSLKRWVFLDVTWASGNRYKYTPGRVWERGDFNEVYVDMSLKTILSLPKHEIYGLDVVKRNVIYRLAFGKETLSNYRNKKRWYWVVEGQYKKKSTVKIVSKVDRFKVNAIGYDAFWNCPHIRKVYIPSTVKSVGRFAFGLKKNKRIRTKVITKLSKSKIRVKKRWTWFGRKVVVKRR